MVACHDLEVHQLDVKTAFLNNELEDEIYMKKPEDFVVQGHEDKVYKLKRVLYGQKQASRQWYMKFHQAIDELRFVPNSADTCFYIKHNGGIFFLFLSLYVDDILIAGDNLEAIKEVKVKIQNERHG